MSKIKKISFKKTLRFALGCVLVIIFLISLIAASHDQNIKVVQGFKIHLNDENEFSFLQKQDIESWLLKSRKSNIINTTIDQLDLKQIEKIAETDPWVANAEIYIDNNRILHIDIAQREPLARIFDREGDSYYMDTALQIMPVSKGYAYPTIVFTNMPVYKIDSMNNIIKTKVAYLSKIISNDSFWNAQITQIEVQPDETFIASPLLGNQKIIIGDTNRIREKLNNLFAFYKNVSSEIGWNTYDTYDLRFKGQIVTSPTIGKTQPRSLVPKTENMEIVNDPEKTGTASTEANTISKRKEEVTQIKNRRESKPPDKTNQVKMTKKSESQAATKEKEDNKPKYIYQERP